MNTTCVMKAMMSGLLLAMVLASGAAASTASPPSDPLATTDDPAWGPDPVWQPNHTGTPAVHPLSPAEAAHLRRLFLEHPETFEGHDVVTYDWDAPDFTACPIACGWKESVHTRTVRCLGSDETSAVDEGRCTESKPAAMNTCGATVACVNYAWDTAAFPPCPDECGTAEFQKSRTVACMGSDGNAAADEMSCADDKPAEAATCAATEACMTYSWDAAAFASCPDECGTADSNQTRAVTCMSSDGNTTTDVSRCVGMMPAETRACAGTEACVTYSWDAWLGDRRGERRADLVEPTVGWQRGRVAAFPACDTKYSMRTCDSASTIQTRTVACVGSDGSIAADETSCAGARPAESNTCPAAEACLVTRAYRGLGQAASGSLLVAVLLAL